MTEGEVARAHAGDQSLHAAPRPGAGGPDTGGSDRGRSTSQHLAELWELVRAYLRQETLDPLRDTGRFVLFGVAGAFLLGIGSVLLGVGALRAVQTETGKHLTGHLTWVPYLIVVIGLVAGGGVALRAASRRHR